MSNKRRGVIGAHLTFFGLDSSEQSTLASRTTFENPDYTAAVRYSPFGHTNIPDVFEFHKYDDLAGSISIPRGAYFFLPKEFRKQLRASVKWKDRRTFAPATFPKCKLTLNKEQQQCMDALEDSIARKTRPFGNLLFLASTSVGKTILQAVAAARMGQRTMVIVPTQQIMMAWYGDLQKAFGFTRKHLGLIKQGSFKFGDAITLCSLQTLGRRRKKWPLLNRTFGTIVVDEVQSVTAPTLFEFLDQSPAAYLIGATATQGMRNGGINHRLVALFGREIIKLNTYSRETATSMMVSSAKLINTDFRFEGQRDNIDWHELALAMSTDEERNELIVANVYKDWLEGRVVLLTVKLREHQALLHELLLEAGVRNVNLLNGDTNSNRHYTRTLIQGINSRRITCVIATMQAFKTGGNIPALDSLHIAMPPANGRDLEQLIGRIRRKADGKTRTDITYYLDNRVGYLMHLFDRITVPTFNKLHLPGFDTM